MASATTFASLALPGATAQTETAIAFDVNLSNNPVLATGLNGYSVQEGASSLRRVSIQPRKDASYAAKVTSAGPTVRLREPQEAVVAGEKWLFASDVRAAGGGETQVTVSWYDAQGRFLSWSAGESTSLAKATWQRVRASLVVPTGARTADTVVNVLGTTTNSNVYVTRHSVVRPTPTGTPAPAPAPAPTVALNNKPAQPALVAYGSGSAATPFAEQGSLVIAGRVNYADAPMKAVSAAGGTVLVYLDAVIDNPYGRYHQMLNEQSVCGPATTRWPGGYKANEWGYLNDFRPGSVLQGKLECVLEKIVAENPHIGGFFADDLGSRSWFAGFSWSTFGAQNQQDYRAGAIALSKTLRKVSDRHDLIFLVNGTWGAGSLSASGGGYPDTNQHGNALADGGFAEHHVGDTYWARDYPCSSQWAAQSSVTHGTAFNLAVTNTDAERKPYIDSGCYAFVATQASYSTAPVWGSFHRTGLPSQVLR